MLPGRRASLPIPVENLGDHCNGVGNYDDGDNHDDCKYDDDHTCQVEDSCIFGRTPGRHHVCKERAPKRSSELG